MKTSILHSFALALLLLAATVSQAQNEISAYWLSNSQHALTLNPATKLKHKVNVAIPGLGGIGFSATNTVLTPRMVFGSSVGEEPSISYDRLLRKWKNRNYIGAEANLTLLAFGFQLKEKNYVYFSVRDQGFYRVTLPEDLLEFPFVGNANFDYNNGAFDLGGLGVNAHYYRAWTVGYQRQLTDQLRVGGGVKFLQGFANINTKRSDVLWQTDRDDWSYAFSGQVHLQSSLPDSIDNLQASDFTNSANRGWGLDLGATYQWNDKLTLAASLVDLGYIRWKNNTRQIQTDELDIVFDGLDYSQTVLEADSTTTFDIEEELEAYENRYSESEENYSTSLHSRMNVSAAYTLYERGGSKGSAGVLLSTQFYKGRLLPAYSVSYTQEVGAWLQANLNYSYANRGSNIGFGMSVNLFPVQWYVAVDNLLAASTTTFVTNDDPEGQVVPYNMNLVHFHTGFNLTFGRKDKLRKNKKSKKKGLGGYSTDR